MWTCLLGTSCAGCALPLLLLTQSWIYRQNTLGNNWQGIARSRKCTDQHAGPKPWRLCPAPWSLWVLSAFVAISSPYPCTSLHLRQILQPQDHDIIPVCPDRSPICSLYISISLSLYIYIYIYTCIYISLSLSVYMYDIIPVCPDRSPIRASRSVRRPVTMMMIIITIIYIYTCIIHKHIICYNVL